MLNRFGFISALTNLLSQSDSLPVLPHFRRFVIDVYASPQQLVAGCTQTWRKLAHALSKRHVALHIYLHSYVLEADISNEAAEELRSLMKAFEEQGVKATVSYPSRTLL